MSGISSPTPFRIEIPQPVLDDLTDRLSRTRWAPELANDDWGYGTNGSYLRDLVDHWVRDFDWRRQEAAMNRFEHYNVEIAPGVPIHFIHARSKGARRRPLILTHGWPWTFWDWHALIEPLSNPEAFGGDPADAFDVIVPSLPGYGFSVPLERTGITAPIVADLWHRLMHDVLGYERYAAAGGDWGAFVTWELGTRYADSIDGIYLSFPPIWHAGGVEALKGEDYAPEEAGWLARTRAKWETAISHLTVHSRDHQTLAWALNDSPAGLAAWILERRRAWSDCGSDLDGWFGRDFLLTTLTIYWVTQSIGSSMQLYAEQFRAGAGSSENYSASAQPAYIRAPTAVGVYPGEVALIPRSACQRVANLVDWAVLPAGGHFAPSEVPEVYTAELRRVFRAMLSA